MLLHEAVPDEVWIKSFRLTPAPATEALLIAHTYSMTAAWWSCKVTHRLRRKSASQGVDVGFDGNGVLMSAVASGQYAD